MEKLLDVRYPPYIGKLEKFQKMSTLKPNFDREGREIKGVGYWLSLVFSLGGESIKGAILRWALVALVAVGTKRWQGNNGLPSWLR